MKTITAIFALLLSVSLNLFAGRPSATDSSTLNFVKPAGYMDKYLNVDRRSVRDPSSAV